MLKNSLLEKGSYSAFLMQKYFECLTVFECELVKQSSLSCGSMCTMRVAACTDKEASISPDLESQVGFELPSVGVENEIRISERAVDLFNFF